MLRHFAEGAFSSRHLNLLNLHLGIVNFGQYLRLVFSGVFLIKMGLSLAAVLLVMGMYIGLRWIFRAPLTLVPHYYGSKAALMLGQAMLGVAFLAYSQVTGWGPWLWVALALNAAGEAIYWHAVHTTFATLSEQGKFGRQLAARNIFMGIGGMLAPFTAALMTPAMGFHSLFILAATSIALSFIPLFFMPEPCPPKPIDLHKGLRINKAGMELFGGWGALSAVTVVIWPIIVFLELGEVSRFGYVMGITLIISFLLTMFVARRIDLGKGHGAVVWGCAIYGAVLMLMAALGRDEFTIICLSAVLTLASSTFNQPFGTALYRWAKETHDPLWFHFWAEMGWDLGNAAVLFSAALMLWYFPTLDMRWLMLAALPAIGWVYYVYQYHHAPARVVVAHVPTP